MRFREGRLSGYDAVSLADQLDLEPALPALDADYGAEAGRQETEPGHHLGDGRAVLTPQ